MTLYEPWFDLQLDALNFFFSASSWRSYQGYTKMYGQPIIKNCMNFVSRQFIQL